MDVHDAIQQRHSVRSYTQARIPEDVVRALRTEIERCNAEGDLNLKLVVDDPDAFGSFTSHYGRFSGVRNYICCMGKKDATLEQRLAAVCPDGSMAHDIASLII